MHGWTGKILQVNLTDKTTEELRLPPETYLNNIGGKGLAGELLFEHLGHRWDDPQMSLAFMTGPLNNTSSPTSGRMTVMSRSPLTGAICDASVGGKMGTILKRAGYDGIVVTGQSEGWCGLNISDTGVTFSNATHLTGLPVSTIHARLSDVPAMQNGAHAMVGPAAENGVRYAAIVFDGHYFAGRGGLGLVMAAKKLKHISVCGSLKTEVFERAELKGAQEEIYRLVAASPVLTGDLGITHYGTGALYDLIGSRRMMPTHNFRQTWFEHAPTMNAHAYKQQYDTKKFGCAGCHILCKKIGAKGEIIPEFETMSHFSALLGNQDLEAVVEANQICNEAGMDTISAAVSLATSAELSGQVLTPESFLKLLREIAAGTGAGATLGQGALRFATAAGRPEIAMVSKGLEFPAYDPRGALGMALAYATSTRGGCHLRAYPISHEILRKPVATDRFSLSGKARIIKISEDLNAVVDSLTACKFLFFAASLEEYARALNAVTGMQTSAQQLLKVGERIYYRERIINARNGFSAADDDIPARFFAESGSSSESIRVLPVDRDEFLQERAAYYRIRGLDENGLPTPHKAAELGLSC
ncbi:aldehyde ferredoxin oxidoreductase family protein [Geopsychrobacter electrodiphilus]|uniref:aldehyde ferredoxin oxidoreductase family protein n=1 Tax=Geopsychrobacter electrodiphilus TaxID=225196 RepID=UPI00035E12B7|nr:aldehyde ferredoxin oxidoreductase family protein [Geopsychrobacter electrodiphilus]